MDGTPREAADYAQKHGIKIDEPGKIIKIIRLMEASAELVQASRKAFEAEMEVTRLRREIVRLRVELGR